MTMDTLSLMAHTSSHRSHKKITLGILIAVAISGVCIVISCVALITHFPKSREVISFGNREYSKGDNLGGKLSYTLAFALDSDLRKAVNECHQDYILGHLEDEFDQCNRSIARYDNVANLYFDRGRAYAELTLYAKASADFTRAIELIPTNSEFYYDRGNSYQKLKQYALAAADFTKLISIDPSNPSYYVGRANAYIEQLKIDLALLDCKKAIQLNDNLADGHFCMGRLYQAREKYGLAIPEYNRAIGLNPKLSEAYFNRGVIYATQNDYFAALTDFKKAIENYNNYTDAYVWRGNMYANLGIYDKAIDDYQTAISLLQDPKVSSYMYCVQGITYIKMNEYSKAITSLQIGVANDTANEYDWCKSALEYIQQAKPNP